MTKDTLYFFVHIPKTGGAMFNRNAESYFSRSQLIRLHFSYQDYYYDLHEKRLKFYRGAEDFYKMVASLSASQKRSVRYIGGHDVEFGMHHLFPQPAQYFVFFREPIARTISLYNHHKTQYEQLIHLKKRSEGEEKLLSVQKSLFLIGNQIPTFEEWLEVKYDTDIPLYFSMKKFLSRFKFLTSDSFDQLFEKFFFIGLTETLEEDTLYLSHEIGIRRFWADQNRSKQYITYSQLDKRVQERLREKNREDFPLYLEAKRRNREFKEKSPHFKSIVERMGSEKSALFLYEKGVHTLKKMLRPIVLPIRDRLWR